MNFMAWELYLDKTVTTNSYILTVPIKSPRVKKYFLKKIGNQRNLSWISREHNKFPMEKTNCKM